MKQSNLIAKANVTIRATADTVWDALTSPYLISKYMFGATVTSEWTEGSSISWKSEREGKLYEDKGTILKFIPDELLKYSHFSPSTGLPDKPENYHMVTIRLKEANGKTEVSLTQDKNANEEEKVHSEKNWTTIFEGLKKVAE
jgi:uncharacterized protein YndB with AHSA1/START domain